MLTTAHYEGVLVANRKRIQEKQMPQSDSQAETNEQVPDPIDAALDAALEKAGVDLDQKAIQSAAEAEERRAAQLIAQSRAQQDDPLAAPEPEENLVALAAKGREHLLNRLREHAARTAAKRDEYRAPPMTDRQREKLEAEQDAGRRARERHEAEAAARPPPPAREVWDGTNTPVMRPGGVVPDPTVPASSGFAAGNRQYGPDA